MNKSDMFKESTCPSCGGFPLQHNGEPVLDLTEGYVIKPYKCPKCGKTGKRLYAVSLEFIEHDED